MVKVSVVTMTYNNIGTIMKFIDSLKKQTFNDFEIVAVDSNSSDGTRELLAEAGAKIVDLPKEKFSFGRGRNLGISSSKGDIVAFLSADAGADQRWLETIVDRFNDKELVFLFGKQIHKSDKRNVVTLSRKMRYNIYWERKKDLVLDRSTIFYASTVNSACRKSVRFDETLPAAEDRAVAMDLINNGEKLIYCPDCIANHLESMNMKGEWKKMRREGMGDKILLGKYNILGKMKFWRFGSVLGLITLPLILWFPLVTLAYLGFLYLPSFMRLVKFTKKFGFDILAVPASIVGAFLDFTIAFSFVGG